MNFLSAIEAKRDGEAISPETIRAIVVDYTSGRLPDYQVAAFLMAVFFRGLDATETKALTLAMRDSGEQLHFPPDPRPLVDKHSTGGVGDKVSLPLAPLLACLGFRVPMISGRGLGITGGTLDKLESIPGFTCALPVEKIATAVQETGCVICGQTDRMVPADKGLYALRDVTGTVPSIPLIVASILSKKVAEGLQALVLDVKFGAAAFMRSRDRAQELGRALVQLGTECGVRTHALLTNMSRPLGRSAGNWLEVKEAVACLEGKGPSDLRDVVIECAAQLMAMTGEEPSLERARETALACLHSGAPRKKWNQLLLQQGAALDAFESKLEKETTARVVVEVKAAETGFVASCDARVIGEAVRDLGAGRLTKSTTINHDVGVDMLAKPGEEVRTGGVIARVHATDETRARIACERIRTAFVYSREPVIPEPLIQQL